MTDINSLKRHKIGVLAGGFSSEREISLKSGKAVFEALRERGLDVSFIDVTGPSLDDHIDIDVAFIALHGRFGEDGTVQKILAERRITYTGSGPDASRVAMDKIASKDKFRAAGLKVAEHIMVRKGETLSWDKAWYPCVVKPRCEGSSVGLSVVRSKDALAPAISNASGFGDDIMVEKFIPGRELTIGILDESPLPVVEIVAAGGVYDFVAKYKAGDTKYICPAKIDMDLFKRAQEVGLRAHQALGCHGISRVDVRLTDLGELFVLEVNTIPGMTERSLLPMAARVAGMDFGELCCRILEGAIKQGAGRKAQGARQ